MTDAHAKAVEAALLAVVNRERAMFGMRPVSAIPQNITQDTRLALNTQTAITAYLATMAEAGWVMVRDVEVKTERQWIAGPLSLREASVQDLGRDDGWNACRAAMLKGAGDEQG